MLVQLDADMTTNQLVHAQPARNIKITLLAPKPPSKDCQPVAAAKPSSSHRREVSVGGKKLPALTGVPVKRKKPVNSEAEIDHSDTDQEGKVTVATKKKKRSKKKARTDDSEEKDTQLEEVQPLVQKKRGRPRKPIEDKPMAGLQPFNASVFVSVENPPQLVRGKTHKSDRLAAQDPRVEGPFTLIRSMKWTEFLHEVAQWVGVDQENLRVNGLSWGFQKQKARLPLTNEEAFKTMREQVKSKISSATVIFVYHPICKQPQSRGQQDTGDQAIVNRTEDGSRWGKMVR